MSTTPPTGKRADRGLTRRDFLVAGTAAGAGVLLLGAGAQEGGAAKGRLEVVGHSPLLSRGMNSAPAIHGDYIYVGSRTDGTHRNAGVLVVDKSDPSNLEVVNQIGPPEEGNVGETSRELRVWPEKDLLMVLNFGCSELLHDCKGSATVDPTVRFFDISGENARDPELVSTYEPSRTPHEFYLWVDPEREGRALLYQSTPSNDEDNLLVTDISGAREGEFEEVVSWTIDDIPEDGDDNRMHSLSVSPDGREGYLAYLGAGFFNIDTSELAEGVENPEIRQVTPTKNRPDWGDPGAHTAVPLPGRDYALATDEVYGKFFGALPEHGCPWGWTRIIDNADPTNPEVVSQYKVHPFNDPEYCDEVPPDRNNVSSFSSHNPTLTKNLAFITWHSAGLQTISLNNPEKPKQIAEFSPEPLERVDTEDPALSSGRDKVVMWSYPIISDGLIYVTDVRNGLYVLEYKGPFAGEVKNIDFLEGNSNLGDAFRVGR